MGSVVRAGRRLWPAAGLAVPLVLLLGGVSAPVAAADAAGAQGAAVAEVAEVCGKKTGVAAAKGKPKGAAGARGTACTAQRGGTKPKAERGPAGPQGPPGPCVDIDTVGVPGSMSGAEYSAALTRGRTYVGYRSAPTGAYAWKDLTNYRQTPGYPRNACGVSVKVADRVYVKVLTTAGTVFETSCTLTLTCTLGWAAVINP
ncbi:hypothetical protein ACFYYM_22905 [Streptomyces erythrochromogenes]|uniref:hypothetical protein n=1 Tax=Streptomyces erythrochromogenes TaxID=285574 RepID=UPI0036C5F355